MNIYSKNHPHNTQTYDLIQGKEGNLEELYLKIDTLTPNLRDGGPKCIVKFEEHWSIFLSLLVQCTPFYTSL